MHSSGSVASSTSCARRSTLQDPGTARHVGVAGRCRRARGGALAEIKTDIRLTRLADQLLPHMVLQEPGESEGADLAEVVEREVSRRNALTAGCW